MCTSVYEQPHMLGDVLVPRDCTGLSSPALAAFDYAFPHRGRSKAALQIKKETE